MMKNRNKTNLILDFLMFLTMLAIFCVKGEIHEALAYTIGALVVVHLVLHWKQIKVMFKQLIPQTSYQYMAGILALAAIAAVLAMPLYISQDGSGDFGERGAYGEPGERGEHGHPDFR